MNELNGEAYVYVYVYVYTKEFMFLCVVERDTETERAVELLVSYGGRRRRGRRRSKKQGLSLYIDICGSQRERGSEP